MASTARVRVRESGGNLPVDVTSFVGRRREITLAKRLLAESRLVTLTGPGGVGKTRLALRVAGNMRRAFQDRAWFIELEELRDPTVVVDSVNEQLRLGGQSTGGEVDTVVNQLKQREMLLVFDNCEHLLDQVGEVIEAILRSCPGIRVLATSRQSLGIAGESTMVVPPLPVPDLDQLPAPEAYEQYASVRLFVDRARAILPEFEVHSDNSDALMRLSHHLDGNPLAIELAAVRLRSLSLPQLEDRLAERYTLLNEGRRGAPVRQQTLRALIDWSYDLCSPQEKLLWARISVFSGSFNLEAAEYVAADGVRPTDILGSLHSLVDQSVLLREEESGEVRYRLLAALREYGQDKLAEFGEQTNVRSRHREWYAGVIERFDSEWLGPDQLAWVRRLHQDKGNIRLALRSAANDPGQARLALRMAIRLSHYWAMRGLNGEARHWLSQTLTEVTEPSLDRAVGLRMHAWFVLVQGEIAGVRPLLDEATMLAHQHGDETEKSYLAIIRGLTSFLQGDLDRATRLLDEALGRFRDRRVPHGELFSLFTLGLVRGLHGEFEAGLALLEECIALAERVGEVFFRSYGLGAYSRVEFARGSFEQAEVVAKRGLRLQRDLGNQLATAFSMDTLAWVAQRQGRNERAARLFGAALSFWDEVGAASAFYVPFQAPHEEHQRRACSALGDQAYDEAFDRGSRLSSEAAVDFALEAKKDSRSSSREDVRQMPLTKREQEIAELVAQGRTNKDIAESLVIAQRTVEGHVQHILTKLDFSSRAQIAGWVASQKTTPIPQIERGQ